MSLFRKKHLIFAKIENAVVTNIETIFVYRDIEKLYKVIYGDVHY
jgi:hypothetical protein